MTPLEQIAHAIAVDLGHTMIDVRDKPWSPNSMAAAVRFRDAGYRVPPATSGPPPEPPIGTWVKDRHGATHLRAPGGRWSAGPGFLPCGQWEAMWEARGPLVECGPYGEDLA